MRAVLRSVRMYGTLFLYARHYAQSRVIQIVYQLASPLELVRANLRDKLRDCDGRR